MARFFRACARLAALLLLASACSAQLALDYIPPANDYLPPPQKCAEDKVIVTTRVQESVKTVTRVLYKTVTVTSVVRQEQTQVQPLIVTKKNVVTLTQPVYVTNTQRITNVVYRTQTKVVGGGIKTVVQTKYVPEIRTVVRTSVVRQPTYVTQDQLKYITVYNTKSVGTPPKTPTIYVTSTVYVRGPVQLLTSIQYVPKYETKTVPQPAVVRTAYNTQIVTVDRVVQKRGQDVQLTSTALVPQVQYVTKTNYVTKTEQRVVDVVNTVRNTQTNYVTKTLLQPVNVVKTVYVTSTVSKIDTVYVTQPVAVTTTRVVQKTHYGPEVVRTAVNYVTKQVVQPGPQVVVTSYSKVVRFNTQTAVATSVVQRYVDRTVTVTQPCDGYNYVDQGNPLGI